MLFKLHVTWPLPRYSHVGEESLISFPSDSNAADLCTTLWETLWEDTTRQIKIWTINLKTRIHGRYIFLIDFKVYKANIHFVPDISYYKYKIILRFEFIIYLCLPYYLKHMTQLFNIKFKLIVFCWCFSGWETDFQSFINN